MQTNDITPERLRRLACAKVNGGKVLSVFLNLDPSQFATPQARRTAISSVLDEADRRARDEAGALSHDQKMALREDVERVRSFFQDGEFDPKGAHAIAVYASAANGLFEALKLPRPVENEVVIDDTPFVEPLTRLGRDEHLAILLVNRRSGRILLGSRHALEQVERIDDDVHGRHDQGGWSQARYQRSVDQEVHDHIKHVADELFARFKRRPFDLLVIGTPEEAWPDVEKVLHPYLRERCVGRVGVDVENTPPEDVREAVQGVLEEHDRHREQEALERLAEGLGQGSRAVAGLPAVLDALNERRAEILLIAQGHDESGVQCRRCGWLGPSGVGACPADGAATEERPNIVEAAVESAIAQSAEVVFVAEEGLRGAGPIGAVLRF